MLHLTLTSAACFEDKWYDTHLMSDPEGNSFVFLRVLMFPSTLSRKHQDSRENKTNWFPEGPDISVLLYF